MSVRERTEAIFGSVLGYGKSPCLLRYGILTVANLEQAGLVLRMVNMEVFHV
jgi:hypothetical protein